MTLARKMCILAVVLSIYKDFCAVPGSTASEVAEGSTETVDVVPHDVGVSLANSFVPLSADEEVFDVERSNDNLKLSTEVVRNHDSAAGPPMKLDRPHDVRFLTVAEWKQCVCDWCRFILLAETMMHEGYAQLFEEQEDFHIKGICGWFAETLRAQLSFSCPTPSMFNVQAIEFLRISC
jgi:hypothetical protein